VVGNGDVIKAALVAIIVASIAAMDEACIRVSLVIL
jgi:hypothetical protein